VRDQLHERRPVRGGVVRPRRLGLNRHGGSPAAGQRSRGFSLAELVAVIAVVGILSVVAVSRLSGGFADTRATYDQLFSQVSYGRKAAIAQRRAVFVRIEATQSRLCYSAGGACAGGDGVPSPTGSVPFTVTVPAAVTVTAATFQFDALGRYLDSAGAGPGASLVISVSGDGAHAFTVERETGYVHP